MPVGDGAVFQVIMALANHLQLIEAEKQKLRTQVRRLCQENAWLRDELASTQQRLQASEQTVAQLEEEKRHLEFMRSVSKYDQDVNDDNASEHSRSEKPDPVVDLFPDDDNEDRNSMSIEKLAERLIIFVFPRYVSHAAQPVAVVAAGERRLRNPGPASHSAQPGDPVRFAGAVRGGGAAVQAGIGGFGKD
jgi:regulator of replication initiation timing